MLLQTDIMPVNQWAYNAKLAEICGPDVPKQPDWLQALYAATSVHILGRPDSFRDEWGTQEIAVYDTADKFCTQMIQELHAWHGSIWNAKKAVWHLLTSFAHRWCNSCMTTMLDMETFESAKKAALPARHVSCCFAGSDVIFCCVFKIHNWTGWVCCSQRLRMLFVSTSSTMQLLLHQVFSLPWRCQVICLQVSF